MADRTPRRLRPLVELNGGYIFSQELRKRGVPVETADEGRPNMFRVPLVCAEVFKASRERKNDLASCSDYTLGKIAADIYFEEVRRQPPMKHFGVTRDSKAFVVLQNLGYKRAGLTKELRREIYYVDEADAVQAGLDWGLGW